MSHSVQQVVQLNVQLCQTLFEEVANVGQRMLTAERPTDAMSLAASCAQPSNDKLRAYRQQLSGLAASVQVELTRVTEEHGQNTSRTAHALADEVTRAAAEETEKNIRQQEETLRNFRDPFKQEGTRGGKSGVQSQGELQSSSDEAKVDASVKIAGQGGKVSAQGNMQGNQPQQSGNKSLGQTR
jgi:phasin family protein